MKVVKTKQEPKKKLRAVVEIVFNIVYLGSLLLVEFNIWQRTLSEFNLLYGLLVAVLLLGDACHLLPRVYYLFTTGEVPLHTVWLGIGKLLTSVTMTVFYVLLVELYSIYYSVQLSWSQYAVMYTLLVLRLVLVCCPQNAWFSGKQIGNWHLYRNVPFLLLGIWVIALFVQAPALVGTEAWRSIPVAISLSFIFYIPVVIFAPKYPKVGALMLPKTCAYMWLVLMLY